MNDYGKIAYEAYCEHMEYVSAVDAFKQPPFKKQDLVIQAAWEQAAKAVLTAYSEEFDRPGGDE